VFDREGEQGTCQPGGSRLRRCAATGWGAGPRVVAPRGVLRLWRVRHSLPHTGCGAGRGAPLTPRGLRLVSFRLAEHHEKGLRGGAEPLAGPRAGRAQFVSTVWLMLWRLTQRTVPPGFTFAAAGENPEDVWLTICTTSESFADVLVAVTLPTMAGWIEQ